MTTTELETVAHWIGGERLEDAARYGEVTDPATGAVTRRVAFASSADVDRAVEAATAGFAVWSAQSLARRSNVLFRFRELVAARAGELARAITAEHGKTVDDARGEVQRGLEVIEFACGAAHLLKGEASEAVGTGVDSHSLRQPLGVAVGITPFNFPAMVPMWMFPLALACGNAFILKPSEKDPSASLLMAEWLAEAGLPDGAFNVAARRPRDGRGAAAPPRRRLGLVRRIDAGREVHLRDGDGARQARPGARRRQEPRRRDARRRRRDRRRRDRLRRLRLGRPALHGDLRGRRGRRRRRRARRGARVARGRRHRRARRGGRAARWARS